MSVELASQKILDYLSLIPVDHKHLNKYNIDTKKGMIEMIGIINNDDFTLAKMIMEYDSECDWHTHEEYCTFILVKGYPYFVEYMEDEEVKIKKVELHQNCFLPPNTPHKIINSTGQSESLVIFIPGNSKFPCGKINF